MKNIILYVIAVMLTSNYCLAQIPSWQWAKAGRGNALALISDNSGNIYVAGNINDSLVIGGKRIPTEHSIYIAKYNPEGKNIWVKTYGENLSVHGINLDANNNIYVAGAFRMADSLGNFHLQSKGVWDVYITKLNNAGDVLWAKSAGGKKMDGMYTGLGVDREGNVYISGDHEDTISFDNIELGLTNGPAIYIAKYDTHGNVVWAKSYDGQSGNDRTLGVAADEDGNVYCTGYYKDNITFGNFNLTRAGSSYFLTKHDKDGNVVWARSEDPSSGGCRGHSVTVDKQGNVYTAGYLNGTVSVGNVQFSAENGFDALLIKYDKDGNVLWAKTISGGATSSSDQGYFVATDPANNVYICGELTSTGFVRKYSADGNLLWKREDPKTNVGAILRYEGVCVGPGGNAHVIGSYIADVKFDDDNFTFSDGNMVLGKLSLFPSGIDGLEEKYTGLQLYPNPTQNSITINCSEQYHAIAIVDVLGRVVLHQNVTSHKQEREVDVSRLSPGMYLLQLQGQINAQGKFIKEK